MSKQNYAVPALAVAQELRDRERRMIGSFEAFTAGWGPVEARCSVPFGSDQHASFEIAVEGTNGERFRVTVERLP